MELLKLMEKRYSCRSFNDKKISREDLNLILQAGYLAPVGKGEYNQLLITVIENRELLNEIDKVGSTFFGGKIKKPTYAANTVVLVSAKKSDNELVQYCNASCIIQNMLLMATQLGVNSVYLFGAIQAVRKDSVLCKKIKLEDGYFPIAAVALGYDTIESRKLKEKCKIETVYF